MIQTNTHTHTHTHTHRWASREKEQIATVFCRKRAADCPKPWSARTPRSRQRGVAVSVGGWASDINNPITSSNEHTLYRGGWAAAHAGTKRVVASLSPPYPHTETLSHRRQGLYLYLHGSLSLSLYVSLCSAPTHGNASISNGGWLHFVWVCRLLRHRSYSLKCPGLWVGRPCAALLRKN